MASGSVVISRRQNLWERTVAQLFREFGAWLYVALVLGLISVLAFVYLGRASHVARQIQEMVRLEQRLAELHEENNALLLSIAKYEEMPRIQAEARAMGLGEASQVEYVEVVVDDAAPAPQGEVIEDAPTSVIRGSQQSVSSPNEASLTVGGLRVAPTIAQQFEAWITNATGGR